MPLSDSELDAGFFNLIHQLAQAPPAVDAERRRHDRQPFWLVQRIAVRRGAGIPDDSAFFEVQCHDLTRQGFAFLLPSRPDFDSLVAALGTPPGVIYVAADVSHCADVLVSASGLVQAVDLPAARRRGRDLPGPLTTPMVLVGCRFVRRLQR